MRHAFDSKFTVQGVSDRTIQELGRWKSLAMVERYTHLSPDHKAGAVERIAPKVSRTCSMEVPAVSSASRESLS
jgi:site-specific recombinase XerD